MPAVHVEMSDLHGSARTQAERLYAEPKQAGQAAAKAAPKPKRASFAERSAGARGRIADRKRAYQSAQKQAAPRRPAAHRVIRGAARRSLRIGRTVHRAAGSPGNAVGALVGMFLGAGILVAVVRNPAMITVPLNFIGSVLKAFTGLLSGPPAAPKAQPVPAQNSTTARVV